MKPTLLLCLFLLALSVLPGIHLHGIATSASLPQAGSLCVHADPRLGLIGYACKTTSPGRLPADATDALGQPLCWWTATAAAFDQHIEGVSRRVGLALVSLRNTGARPSAEAITELPRVGDSFAERVAQAVAVDCGPLRVRKVTSGGRSGRYSGGSNAPSSR